MVAETQFLFSAFFLPPESDFVDTTPASFSAEELGKSGFSPFLPTTRIPPQNHEVPEGVGLEGGWRGPGDKPLSGIGVLMPPPFAWSERFRGAHRHVLPSDQLLLATLQTSKSGFCEHLEALPRMLLAYVSVLPGNL